MTKNDILHRLRYTLKVNDAQVGRIIANTGRSASATEIASWLKREDDPGWVEIPDAMLCSFMDGLIIEKRGARAGGAVPEPLESLSNNEILKKVRIALELRDDDLIAVFKRVDFVVTKAELGSFFRHEGHRNYRKCPEQVLRKFLQGLGEEPGIGG